MKKSILLLAGYPGTGKSYLSDKICEMAMDISVISQDVYKEALLEKYGYDNLQEKEALVKQSWKQYYLAIEQGMRENRRLLSDYPFSEKQRPILKELAMRYGHQVLTIRLLGDIDILYERQKQRDLDPQRHLSHIVSHYHQGDVMEDRSKADGLLSYEEFKKRCTSRGYDSFVLGDLIELDVSDFEKVDYPALLRQIKEYL